MRSISTTSRSAMALVLALAAPATVSLTLPETAYAGDVPIYAPAPDWVEQAHISQLDLDGSPPLVLAEKQARLERGRVWTYADLAVKLDSPQALTQMGTLTASWLPDKGDLVVHRVELWRGGKQIDLLASGSRFEILRRESQLENRVISGLLTATMNVSGAQVGDILRMSISTTLSDQAMGDEVQFQDAILTEPIPIGSGRITISWPEDLPIRWQGYNYDLSAPELRDGFRYLDVAMPIAKRPEIPGDAPLRYHLQPLVQASSFADYAELSAVMARHYSTEGAIPPGSTLDQRVRDIAARSDAPLTRAAAALRLAQDEISYLLNGLDGGNYLPQSPKDTWEYRYGDCKAKSLLLLAMLRELGIESEAVLVRTQAGDALPGLLPMPGNFDHMIVRATIDGVNYWLDATMQGTRLATIDEVPRFFHALPLRAEGARLVELEERPQTTPDQAIRLTIDQRAGVSVPALYDIEMVLTGSMGAALRPVIEGGVDASIDDAVYANLYKVIGDNQIVERTLVYDDAAGVARITATGLITTPWKQESGLYQLEVPGQAAADISLEGNRSRPAWREIPLRIHGPFSSTSEVEVLLPEEGQGFTLRNTAPIDTTIAGVRLLSAAELEDGRVTVRQSNASSLEELPADGIPEARRLVSKHLRDLPLVVAPKDARQRWEYLGERERLAPIEEAYRRLIDKAEPDDATDWLNRASFRAGTLDYAGALEDYDKAMAIEPSADLLRLRASAKRALGDLDGALAELQAAEDLQPDGTTHFDQVELLGHLGRKDQAIAVAEDYASYAQSPADADQLKAIALGWAGRADEGLSLLRATAQARPGDRSALNELCWFAGIWNMVDDSIMADCVKAVESSEYSAAVLDSRALAHFRLGDHAAALADADAAIGQAGMLAQTRYLRGLVLHKLGRGEEARAAIAEAKAMRPGIVREYASWGLKP